MKLTEKTPGTAEAASPAKKTAKQRAFEIICKTTDGDTASHLFDLAVMILIGLSVVSIVLESYADIYEKYHAVFHALEVVIVAFFTVEFILRIWTADLEYPDSKHPRLRYIFSFMSLVDLMAILPFYLPFFNADLRVLHMFRIVHLFQLMLIFKLGRYFEALQVIVRAIRATAPQLIMTLVICFLVLLFSSIILYSAENPMQPENFPNVPATLGWAVNNMTNSSHHTGIYPVTPVGRFFASFIGLVGFALIAVPSGIIASGFAQVAPPRAEKHSGKRSRKHGAKHSGEPADRRSAAPSAHGDSLQNLDRGELLSLQMEVARRLREYDITVTVTPADPAAPPSGPES